LLHSVYLILASASFGFALVTCNKQRQLLQKMCFTAQQRWPFQYTIQTLPWRDWEKSVCQVSWSPGWDMNWEPAECKAYINHNTVTSD
jgi:hypothetical protein